MIDLKGIKELFKKKTGLALGGGAMLGAAHIGVLKAFHEHEQKVDFIAGTSIGALIGALYAFGKSWEEILNILQPIEWMDVSGFTLNRSGILSNKKLGSLIEDELGDVQLEDAKIPLAIVATNIANGEKVVLKEGPLSRAVMASTCIPGVFTPIEWDGTMLVDGGVTDNIPIQPLCEMGADKVIGVDLNAKNQYEKPGNMVEVILNAFHFMLMHASKLNREGADIIIEPDLANFSMLRTGNVSAMVEKGYAATCELLDGS